MANTFNPKERPQGTGGSDDELPAGQYILAMDWFTRKTSKAGNPYLRCHFRVVAGPAKGKGFYSSMGLDTSKQGTANRWSLYCDCVGVEEAFDLDDDGELAQLFKWKPFVAIINRRQEGQYVNNDIERYVLPRDLGEDTKQLMEAWLLEREAEQEVSGGGGYGGDAGDYDESDWPQDDDIPFAWDATLYGERPGR